MSDNPDHDFIPLKKLNEGFLKCQEQTSLLLTGSQMLHDSKKYPASIALSILALEECSKLSLIAYRAYEKKGISKNDWKSLSRGGSHTTKLSKPLKDAREELLSKSEDAYNLVASRNEKISDIKYPPRKQLLSAYEKDEKLLEQLNIVKKLCLYVDWNSGKWKSLLSDFSSQQKKALSSFLLTYVGFVFNNELLGMKYPHFPHDESTQEYKNFINDPLWIEAKEYEKIAKTNQFKKNQLIANSIIQKL